MWDLLYEIGIVLAALLAAGGAVALTRYLTKSNVKSTIETELAYVRDMLEERLNSQEILHNARNCVTLCKVEGFSSVLTLLKHRHVSRAKVRMAELIQEWEENGLKLYDRK